jgi:hypothetical protein
MSSPSPETVQSGVERHWPIASWMLILAVVAATGVIGTTYQLVAGRKTAARLIVDQEVMRHHWSKLEPDRQFVPVIQSMATGFDSSRPDLRWTARFIGVPGKPATGLDAFEDDSLTRIQNGEDEVWDQTAFGVTRYVRAIRATQVCVSCHQVLPGGGFAKVNDVVGIISVDFRQDRAGANGSASLGTGGN